MPLEKWSDRITIVHLADDPQFSEELDALEHSNHQPTDVLLDFAAVHFINSSNIARLLALRKKLHNQERELVLCCVGTQVWGAFLITGLDKIFVFRDDVPTALAGLQMR